MDERSTVDDGNNPNSLAITGKLNLGAMGEEVFRQWMHFPFLMDKKKPGQGITGQGGSQDVKRSNKE
jgi:hypothetical protein